MKGQAGGDRITIIGGGPVGTLLALYLAKRGLQIDLYEKREDPRKKPYPEGRSINLALSTRGLYALHEVDCEAQLFAQAVPMKGRLVHAKDQQQHFIAYSPDASHVIYSISRLELNKLLLDKAEHFSNINLHFNEECLDIDAKQQKLLFKNKITGQQQHRDFDIVFDAEGIWSALRACLLHMPYTNYSQQYLDYDYKELTIPARLGNYTMEKNALHLWPRGSHLMIALPNPDGSFTCTIFMPHGGEMSFAALATTDKALAFFEREFPDALALAGHLPQQFINYPVGRLATIKVAPWLYHDNIVLMGDAAHGIVPFYGQGLNCSFEDCSFLNQCLDKHPGQWKEAFMAYELGRRENTDAISELSFDNFIELREKVSDPVFRLKRELERLLEATYPDEFLSKYSMVTFSRLPYKQALIRGRQQDLILMQACENIQDIKEIDLLALKQQLKSAIIVPD